MPLGWSISVPSLNWIRLTVPELGRLQFSIDRQLKVPIFTFLGGKGGKISNFIFLTPKGTTLARTTDCAWGVFREATCGRGEETFMRQTGYLPRPPT